MTDSLPSRFVKVTTWQLEQPEAGIYERKQEDRSKKTRFPPRKRSRKKERKPSLGQIIDQEKKQKKTITVNKRRGKIRSRPRKK